jgi:hypothetical protein
MSNTIKLIKLVNLMEKIFQILIIIIINNLGLKIITRINFYK